VHQGHRDSSSLDVLAGVSPAALVLAPVGPGSGARPGIPAAPDWATVRDPTLPGSPPSSAEAAVVSGLTEAIVRSWPRMRRTRGTEASMGLPSAPSAGTSAALWRA